MPAPPTSALLRALGVLSSDVEGNQYRVIVGERQGSANGIAYDIYAAAPIPPDTTLAIPGLAGQWVVSGSSYDRDTPGLWHGTVSG